MKIIIESTAKIVHLQLPSGAKVPARVWQGHVINGDAVEDHRVPVQVFVTRIAPEIPENDPDIDSLTAQFKRELQRCADPRASVEAQEMTDRWYILKDKVPVPCADLHEWARWASQNGRHVAYDQIGEITISTIFLGCNHRHLPGPLPPILFETVILGGERHGYQVRTCTWHEAEEAHTQAWDLVAGVHA